MNLLKNSKHPWIRVIIGKDTGKWKKGDVFDIGFGWTKAPLLPGISSKGRFRCLDTWNYQSAKSRVVTSIPISIKETQELHDLILNHQRMSVNLDKHLGFNLFRHNCTAFINAVGDHIPRIGLETNIGLKDLVVKISPDWLKFLGSFPFAAYQNGRKGFYAICARLPKGMKVVLRKIEKVFHRFIDFLVALPLNIFGYLTGSVFGSTNHAFAEKKEVKPELLRTSTDEYFYFLPGILQEWQKRQASTVIHSKPSALAVAPPVQ